jgi:hypothetical protein
MQQKKSKWQNPENFGGIPSISYGSLMSQAGQTV